jgi:hypothetical protein
MNLVEKIESITDDLKLYFSTNVELVKLQALERSSSFGSRIIAFLIIGMTGMTGILFASIWAALELSARLEGMYLGFGIVAGFYLLIAIILLATRKSSLEVSIRDGIVKKAMNNESPD